MERFRKYFGQIKPIIGMVHVGALPGTPMCNKSLSSIIKQAISEALILQECGVNAIMIENMHDIPYISGEASPDIVAAMTAIACGLRSKITLPMGIQILAGANKSALAVAKAADLQFIRVENFVFAHIADEGFMQSCAGKLLRYRRMIDAENILVFTDIKKKHSSHQITADVSLKETAETANFFLSDAVIITGSSTSVKPDISDLEVLADWHRLPKLIGSGITVDNIENYWDKTDGFIVGSSLKKSGNWINPVDPTNVKDFMEKVNQLRDK